MQPWKKEEGKKKNPKTEQKNPIIHQKDHVKRIEQAEEKEGKKKGGGGTHPAKQFSVSLWRSWRAGVRSHVAAKPAAISSRSDVYGKGSRQTGVELQRNVGGTKNLTSRRLFREDSPLRMRRVAPRGHGLLRHVYVFTCGRGLYVIRTFILGVNVSRVWGVEADEINMRSFLVLFQDTTDGREKKNAHVTECLPLSTLWMTFTRSIIIIIYLKKKKVVA